MSKLHEFIESEEITPNRVYLFQYQLEPSEDGARYEISYKSHDVIEGITSANVRRFVEPVADPINMDRSAKIMSVFLPDDLGAIQLEIIYELGEDDDWFVVEVTMYIVFKGILNEYLPDDLVDNSVESIYNDINADVCEAAYRKKFSPGLVRISQHLITMLHKRLPVPLESIITAGLF